jgi:hypothetical protein
VSRRRSSAAASGLSLREADRLERARIDAELTLGEYQTLAHLKQEIDRINSELLAGAAWDSYCREVGGRSRPARRRKGSREPIAPSEAPCCRVFILRSNGGERGTILETSVAPDKAAP